QKELEKILKLNNNIEIIVLKGIPLTEFIYGNIGLRCIGDIDLLVQEKDLEKIKKNLLDFGFKISGYSTENFYRSYHKHFHFTKELENGQKILLEIHWNIVKKNEPFKIDLEEIWKNKISLKNNSVSISVFSLEDAILYADLHLYQHNYSYICFLCDLSEILNFGKDKINWEKVLLLAKKSKLKTITYFGFLTAKKYFDAPISFETLQKFSPFYYKKIFIKSFICSQISQSPFFHKNFLKNAIIQFIIIRFIMIDNLKQFFKYFSKKVFPSCEELKFRYNISSPKLYIFFYIIHPFLLILKLKKYKYVEKQTNKNNTPFYK
ncbi:MAG: nucleotidyltransferase family protein, partial [bacterium]